MPYEIARDQWEAGLRRLDAAYPEQAPTLERVTRAVQAELRRRLGGPFTLDELAELYDEGTGWCTDLAVEYAVRYAAERRNAPRLVLIGNGHYRPPRDAAHVAVHVGYVSEDERRAAYAEALALVQPSRLESLSLTTRSCARDRQGVYGPKHLSRCGIRPPGTAPALIV